MSTVPPPEERDLLAAEYALGLLDGDALREARVLAGSDRDFARAVAGWEARLAPMLDEIEEVEPDPGLWGTIQRAVAGAPVASNDNAVQIDRSRRRWRAFAAGMTALAASLALLVGVQATRAPPAFVPEQPAGVLVATLSSEQAETSLAVAYDRREQSLLVTPGRLAGAAGHDHQLWIIPAGGTPVSLGLVRAGAPVRLSVPAAVAPHFRSRSAVALSVEPTGGSPTGQPTGPVVASGELVIL